MTTEELKKLYDKILCIADKLDDVIKESFDTEPRESNVIYRNLNGAWYKLDAAMDKIYFEIHSQEEKERERLLNWHKERGLEAVTVMVPAKSKKHEAQEQNTDPAEIPF